MSTPTIIATAKPRKKPPTLSETARVGISRDPAINQPMHARIKNNLLFLLISKSPSACGPMKFEGESSVNTTLAQPQSMGHSARPLEKARNSDEATLSTPDSALSPEIRWCDPQLIAT